VTEATPAPVLTGLTVEELGILILALGRMLIGGAEPADQQDVADLYAALSREFHRRFDR
jgi:hypothetical protein